MKIQDFCSKIRDDKDGIFQALRDLQKIEAQFLVEDGTLAWDPWARLATPEPVSA